VVVLLKTKEIFAKLVTMLVAVEIEAVWSLASVIQESILNVKKLGW
jgi:hypothetical protein